MFGIARNETSDSLTDKEVLTPYHAHFARKPFKKGNRKNVYKGVLHGDGTRKGEHVLVKAFRLKGMTKILCERELNRYIKARNLAIKFNKRCPEISEKIKFTIPLKAPVDHVALSNYVTKSKTHVGHDEWVLMEDDLGEEFHEFIKKNGDRTTRDPSFLDAFMHFSYNESRGKLVVVGFHGVHDEEGYHLSCPVIHSLDRTFGETDLGLPGIVKAFEFHRCTNLCYDMLRPPTKSEVSLNAKPKHSYPKSRSLSDLDLEHERPKSL